MNRINLSPLYRSTIGFDRLASLLDVSTRSDKTVSSYPAYDIEVVDENRYEITLAVAGFERSDLDIEVEKGVLTVKGSRPQEGADKQFLYRGIGNQTFERRFNLADHIEVADARLRNGLLTIELVKEVPEAMKPKSIPIQVAETAIEHKGEDSSAAA